MQRILSYHKNDEDETEVYKESLVKAYRYGKSFIPFVVEDDAQFKYVVDEKEFKVVSFTPRSSVSVETSFSCCWCFLVSCQVFSILACLLAPFAVVHLYSCLRVYCCMLRCASYL